MKKLLLLVLLATPCAEAMDAKVLGWVTDSCRAVTNPLFHTLNKELLEAAKSGDVDRLRELLSYSCVDVNYRCQDWRSSDESLTPLILAICKGDIEPVRMLLDHEGTDVNVLSKDSWHALSTAVRDRSEILQLLLDYQKENKLNPPLDIDGLCQDDRTPLNYAVEEDAVEPIRLLLEHGANPNIPRGTWGAYPLHMFVLTCFDREAAKEVIWMLVENGATVDCKDREQQTPLALALNGLDTCLGWRTQEHKQKWPLLLAFSSIPKGLEETLQGAGLEGALEGSQEQRDLLLHIWQSPTLDTELITAMLCQGASLNAPCEHSSLTPCMILVVCNRLETLKELCLIYPDVDLQVRAYGGWHILHFAGYKGFGEMVRYLLSLHHLETNPKTASGLSLHDIVRIGAQSRGEESNGAIEMLKQFNEARMVTLISLYGVRKDFCPGLPKDIMKLLVASYRF